MTLEAVGKISMQNIECEKCEETISLWVFSPNIKCNNCGALYELETSSLEDQYVRYEYMFMKFKCMYSYMSEDCQNPCPSPGIYCKEHATDEFMEKVEGSIKYCQRQLAEAQQKLELMKESKRIWLIEEVSGINEDNSV